MGTDRHESRRIDDQLRGRAGRQGDPGSSVFFISLEDDMARIFGNETLRQMLASHMDDDTPLSMNMINKAIENAQKEIEARNFGARKSVLEYDDVNNVQRNLIYKERMSVLSGADIRSNLQDFLEVYIDTSFRNICPENKKERDLKKMQIAAFYYLPQSDGFFREEDLSADADKLRKEWGDIVRESFENVAASRRYRFLRVCAEGTAQYHNPQVDGTDRRHGKPERKCQTSGIRQSESHKSV